MEIGKLFAAIGVSVQQAQEYLSRQDVERYLRYFTSADGEMSSAEPNDAFYPKVIRFSLLGKENNNYIDVPLAVMTSHESIGLKQVKVTISGKIYEDEALQNIQMQTGPSSSDQTAGQNGTVELIFESGPQAEGQARATQKMLDKTEI